MSTSYKRNKFIIMVINGLAAISDNGLFKITTERKIEYCLVKGAHVEQVNIHAIIFNFSVQVSPSA